MKTETVTKRKAFKPGLLWRLVVTLLLLASIVPISSSPASAIGISDYFSYSYTVQFSNSVVATGMAFNATVEANATCTNALPLSPSEALITGRMVAIHQLSSAKVTLNSSYTVTISPFPSRQGESTRVSQVLPLQFPPGSEFGDYTVAVELIEAKVKAGIIWIPVTAYLPSFQPVGSVTYVSNSGGGGSPAPPLSPPPTPPPPPPPAGAGTGTGTGSGSQTPPLVGTGLVGGLTPRDATGRTIASSTLTSSDGRITIGIPAGTKAISSTGALVESISVSTPSSPPPPPTGKNIVGVPFEVGPSGTSFDQLVTLTFPVDLKTLPQGTDPNSVVVAYFNTTTAQWFSLPTTFVPAGPGGTSPTMFQATTTHLTTFAILVSQPPAAGQQPPVTPPAGGATAGPGGGTNWFLIYVIIAALIAAIIVYLVWGRRRMAR